MRALANVNKCRYVIVFGERCLDSNLVLLHSIPFRRCILVALIIANSSVLMTVANVRLNATHVSVPELLEKLLADLPLRDRYCNVMVDEMNVTNVACFNQRGEQACFIIVSPTITADAYDHFRNSLLSAELDKL